MLGLTTVIGHIIKIHKDSLQSIFRSCDELGVSSLLNATYGLSEDSGL